MKRSFLLSLAGVAVLALGLAACTAVGSAHALSVMPDFAAALAPAADPDTMAVTMATLAAGVTASPSLTAEDAEAAAVAVAPRVTLESIEAKIAREETHVFDGVLTVHVLTMANGFKVTGESACASPENFNEELGRKIARDNAIRKVWGFEGYLLREQLSAEAV